MRRAWDAIHALRPADNGSNPNIGLRVYDIGANFGETGIGDITKG